MQLSKQNIQYISQKNIDKKKWDTCIDNASNGLIYGYSIYLDHMAKNWDALVLNDYDAVMPLTWNKKYGIYYLYQPAFTASGGVFGKNIDAATVKDFIDSIPVKFRLIEISMNHGNILPATSGFSITRDNYVLTLQKKYEEL